MDVHLLTLGFARRATAYKRADLLLANPDRLLHITNAVGPVQILYAGKAHPRDADGKAVIERIVRVKAALTGRVKIAYLANYDLHLARLLTAGVDVDQHASTSARGVWDQRDEGCAQWRPRSQCARWLVAEGHTEGVTGWAVGEREVGSAPSADRSATDATSLYDKLERTSRRCSTEPDRFADVMRHSIALNGSFFNSHRMLQEYISKAYTAGYKRHACRDANRTENRRWCIDLKVRHSRQLFDGRDPAPFNERDLDDDAVADLLAAAQEIPRKQALTIAVTISEETKPRLSPDAIVEAVRGHFVYEREQMNTAYTNTCGAATSS